MKPLGVALLIIICGVVLTGLVIAVLAVRQLMKGDIWHE